MCSSDLDDVENDDKRPEPSKDNAAVGGNGQSNVSVQGASPGNKQTVGSAPTEAMKKSKQSEKIRTHVLSKVKRVRIKRLRNGKVKIVWARDKNADGYEIRYAKTSSFKKSRIVRVKGGKNVKKVFTKRLRKKIIYVRIRSRKNVNGAVEHSAWSKTKKVFWARS